MIKSIEEHIKFIQFIVNITKDFSFEQKSAEQIVSVAFYKKMLDSAQNILSLQKNPYDACIIACQMTEGLFHLCWMLDNPKRIKDYMDFLCVDSLGALGTHPEAKETILNNVKNNNIARFLKKKVKGENNFTEEILLNPQNYHDAWYKTECPNFGRIVERLICNPDNLYIQNIYALYKELCAYKHYSPYVILPTYGVLSKTNDREEFISIVNAAAVLFITLFLASKYQQLDISEIAQKYNNLFNS